MGYSLIENLETLHESKEAFLEKLDIILPNPSGLTIHDSWDTIGTFITNILVDNQIFPPETIEELERLLGNTLQKTIQVTATKINPYTFYGESSLAAINALNATTIGQYAFYNCTNLKLANIQAATSIGTRTFYNDSNLTTVGLDSAVNIGEYTFADCHKLEHIDFSKISYINSYAFQNCYKINNLDLSNCTYIGGYAFAGCSNIGPVLYLDSSGTVARNAFNQCTGITEIIITSKSKSLNQYAMHNIGNVNRILCEYPSKPSNWNNNWNYSGYPVYWNAEIKDWVFVYNNDKPNSTLTTRIIDKFPDEGEKEGYVFDGWYTDSTLETKCELPYTSPEAFPVLYAKWTITINIHAYNTETLEWLTYNSIPISNLSDIYNLKLGVTFDDVCVDSEFSIPLTDMSQITPNMIIYIRGITNVNYDLSYTGTAEAIGLPAGTYKLECWGASGGISATYGQTGRGGYACGTITTNTSTIMYCYVGGQGQTGNSSSSTWQILNGGFNGGGGIRTFGRAVSSGGGASDIRIASNSLYARALVAGGGGGTGQNTGIAGHGGGTNGVGNSIANTVGKVVTYKSSGTSIAGSQLYGGDCHVYENYGDEARYSTPGKFGEGSFYYSDHTNNTSAGGGGGGWYGGGTSNHTAGAGGSGWVYTEDTYTNWATNSPEGQSGQWLLDSSCYLVDTLLKAGNESFLAPDGTMETGHIGNGYIRITQIRN